MNTSELKKVISGILEPLGYQGKGVTWHRHHPEVVLVVNLQKSDYGGKYYVNLGVCLSDLNADKYPRENHCHVRHRLKEELFSEAPDPFNLEDTSISWQQRKQLIEEMIRKDAKWLDGLSNLRAITDRLSRDEYLRNRTYLQARRFLGIAESSTN